MGLNPSCLWSLRILPSLPGSCLTNFYRDASPALLQLVNQWLNFTYFSRSHAFRKNNINSGGKNRTHDFRTTSRYAGYLLDRPEIIMPRTHHQQDLIFIKSLSNAARAFLNLILAIGQIRVRRGPGQGPLVNCVEKTGQSLLQGL